MKRSLLLLLLGTAAARAEDHAHHHTSTLPSDAQFVVTINPEARVSVVLGVPLPPPAPCGSAMELRVTVINQGFVTAPLRAAIVGEGAQYVALHMDRTKLSGEAKDKRVIRLTLLKPELLDVTIAFGIDNNTEDLG